MDFSPIQIGIVLLIVLLVFGPSRLPELGKSMGRGIREFKESITSGSDDDPDEDRQRLEANASSSNEPVEGEVVSQDKS